MRTESAGLIAFTVGGLLALTRVLAPDWWTFGNFVNAASAAGTIAAAWAALWLAGRTERKQTAEVEQKASLAAASVMAQLTWVVTELRTAQARYVFSRHPIIDIGDAHLIASCDDLTRCLSKREWELDAALVNALLPLPNHTAHRLEYTCRSLVALRSEVRDVSAEWPRLRNRSKEHALERWFETIADIITMLQVAQRDCERFAAIERLEPTVQELHGDGDYDFD